MRYEWADNPHLIIPSTVCTAVLLLSVAVMIFSLVRIIFRLDFFGSINEQNLPWSVRFGRRDARLHAQFWSPHFQMERRAMAYGAAVFVCTMVTLFAVFSVFGHPA